MSDQDKQDAAELAKKAGAQSRNAAGQGKAAAKNAGRAVKAVTEEEFHDTAEKLEGTVEDAVNSARRINVEVLSRLSSDTGIGFFALSVSIWAGAIAFNKFRGVAADSGRMMRPVTKPE